MLVYDGRVNGKITKEMLGLSGGQYQNAVFNYSTESQPRVSYGQGTKLGYE